MNLLTDQDFCAALVLSLGHFLWQGLVIAVLAAVVVRRLKTARGRYAGLVAALGLMAVSPILTMAVVAVQTERPATPAVVSGSVPNPAAVEPVVDVPRETLPLTAERAHAEPMLGTGVGDDPMPSTAARTATSGVATAQAPASRSDSSWQQFAPLMTDVYLLGVMAMLLRLTVGLWGGWRLRRRSIPVTDAALLQALQRQAASLGMKFVPILAYCERVAVPTVIGILKPTILLPLALMSGLAPEQVEAVLAHELAHLRRYDHLVNLMQRVIESLLFFHPAVWWLSHKIRVEREHCCDDLVVACGAVPLDYAKSLLRVAELSRGAKPHRSVSAVSLLATGQPSTLRQRIARLLGDSAAPQVRLAHSLLVFCLGAICCLLAWVVTAIGWQLAAEAMADHSHSTIVVEWSVIVDEEVAAQIRKLSADPKLSPTEPGELSLIHVDAATLRKLIAGRNSDAGRFQMNENVYWMKTLAPNWRHTGMSHIASGNGLFGKEPEKYLAVWTAFARYFLEQQNGRAHLTIDFELHGSLNDSSPQFTRAGQLGPKKENAPLKGKLKVDESLSDGQAAVIIASTDGLDSWKPNLVVIYEAIRVPTEQLGLFELMTEADDWVLRGATGTKEHVARVAEWRARPSRSVSSTDEMWTHALPNGGHVQLVGLGRPKAAPVIWWTPMGEPLQITYPNMAQNFTDSELVAIVRVREVGALRSRMPRDSTRYHQGELDVEDNFAAPGSQLILAHVVLDPATGKASLKIGAGFGAWTSESKIGSEMDSTATISGIEVMTQSSHEFGIGDPSKGVKATTTNFRWQPTRDYEFTALAVTTSGKVIESHLNPMVYANEPPSTLIGAAHFTHLVPKADIQSFLLKSRPVTWTEFTDFAIEPAVALVPPLEFGKEQTKEARPFSAKLPGGVTVNLVGVGMPPSQPRKWWQADGSLLAERPNKSLDGYHDNGFPNQAACREIALEMVGLPKDHFVTARVGNNVSGVAFSTFKSGVMAYNIASGPFSGEETTTVQVSLTLEPLGPVQAIDAEGRKLADGEVPIDLKPLYDRIQSIRVESHDDQQDLVLKPLGDLLLAADWRLFAIDTNGKEVPPATSKANGEESVWSFKLAHENLARFEYRLRPYRHSVTFQNVSLDAGKKSEVKVTVATLPKPERYVANLPDGRSVELVGITKNTAPAKDGWKPDGRPIGDDVGYWPTTIYISGNTTGAFVENGEHPKPNPGAIDFLFRFRDLKAQPSLTFNLAANGGSYSHLPLKNPYELRISAERRDPLPTGSNGSPPDGEMRVGLTDEPWGKWLQISPAGEVLNPLTDDDLYRSRYEQIQIVGVEPHDRTANKLALVLRTPSKMNSLLAFEIRGIDPDEKSQWVLRYEGHGIKGTDLDEARWGESDTKKKPLTRYEFRLRPYRHWVTFTGVSLEPGKESDVKVKVESIGASERDKAQAEAAPERISFKEAKQLVEGLGGQCYGDSKSDEPSARVQLNGEKVDDATIRKLAGYPKLTSLWLFGMVSVTDDGLSALAHCTSLDNLQLQAPAVTDVGVKHLARLAKLEYLTLSNTKLTDEGLKHIATFPRLTFVSLWSDDVSDAGMQHLARMTSLKDLRSHCPKLTNDGLKALAQSASLEFLQFSSEHVTDEGIGHLASLKTLNGLGAMNDRLTDESLKAIGTCANLGFLELSETKITDAGLEHLKGLTKVDRLHFHGNRSLTGEGLSHLHGLPLKQFTLMGPSTSDKVLEQLAAFPNITHLAVGFGAQASRNDEAYLLTDAGLKHLAALPSLAYLSIDGAAITDAGVVVLKQASLKNVGCFRCPRLTATGKKAWQTAAPHVQITGDFPEPKPVKNNNGKPDRDENKTNNQGATNSERERTNDEQIPGEKPRPPQAKPSPNEQSKNLTKPADEQLQAATKAFEDLGGCRESWSRPGNEHIFRLTRGSNHYQPYVTDEVVPKIPNFPFAFGLNLGATEITAKGLRELAKLDNLIGLYLVRAQVTDDGLKELARFKNLVTLQIWGADVSEAGLKELANLQSVRVLNLPSSPLVDVWVREAAKIENLTSLHLSNGVSDAGMQAIGQMQNLKKLAFFQGQISDAGWEEIGKLRHLSELHLPIKQTLTEANLKQLARLENLTTLSLQSSTITDDGLKQITGLGKLTWLDLSDTSITDAGLKHVGGFEKLETLRLASTKVTDAGLKELARLTNLKRHYMGHTRISNKGLSELVGLKDLTTLDLISTRMTDRGLEYIAQLPNIEHLDIRFTGITGAGLNELSKLDHLSGLLIAASTLSPRSKPKLENIAGLQNLKSLNVWDFETSEAAMQEVASLQHLTHLGVHGNITDDELQSLSDSTSIQHLDVNSPLVTDDGLQSLANLRTLTELRVRHGNVTLAGQAKLQDALPRCDVDVLPINDAGTGRRQPRIDEILKAYPKLTGFSLDMTEQQFLEFVKRQDLKTRKSAVNGKVRYRTGIGFDQTLVVIFDKDGKCTGIEHIRGQDFDVPETPKAPGLPGEPKGFEVPNENPDDSSVQAPPPR